MPHKQPYMQMIINNVALRSVGYKIPSPLVAIKIDNAESGVQTAFTATLHILGDANKQAHVGSFEMMLYEFAQMRGGSVLPCYIEIGWCGDSESIATDEYGDKQVLSIQGQFISFTSTVRTGYMEYVLSGIGNLTSTATVRGIAIPAVNGNYRPSNVVEAVLNYINADELFDYDIDHDDEIVHIHKPSCVTSLGEYINGNSDSVNGSRGLIQESYSEGSKSAAYGLPHNRSTDYYRKAGYTNKEIRDLMGAPVSQTQRSTSSYSFSVTEPTFHKKGVIRYKNNVNLANYVAEDVLIWGGLHTNILDISATYNGVTQSLLGSGTMVQTGMAMTLKGDTLITNDNRQNSYSATVDSMYAAGNALNNLNAVATQFNTNMTVTIVGSPKQYSVKDSVKIVVYTGGTLNPITGIYQILKVSHNINGTSYKTTLTVVRLNLTSANNTVANVSGYTRTTKKNGIQSAAQQADGPLYLGQPFQHLANILKRGRL